MRDEAASIAQLAAKSLNVDWRTLDCAAREGLIADIEARLRDFAPDGDDEW